MSFTIEALNHVCLIVKDLEVAEKFYVRVLGLKRHPKIPTWYLLNEQSTLHLLSFRSSQVNDSVYRRYQHFALQISNLDQVLPLLLENNLKPFQMDLKGNTRPVVSLDDSLDFGVGTVFVRDPDGNLVEFIQMGRGIFSEGGNTSLYQILLAQESVSGVE